MSTIKTFSSVDEAATDPALRKAFASNIAPVVIFPSSHAVAMSVIRALQDTDVPIVAVDFKPAAAGLYSRFVTPLLLPNLYESVEHFESWMLELGRHFATPPVLFLVDDEDLFLSLKHQAQWASVYRLPLSPWSVVQNIVDKGRMYRKLQDMGWAGCPKTWFPGSPDELDALADQLIFPCIIKPTYSTKFRVTFGVKAKKFESFAPLREFAATVFAADIAFVVQEFIPGGEDLLVTLAAYSNADGDLISSSTGRKIHQFPPDFGTCRLAETMPDPKLERIGGELLKLLGYRGISLGEFKQAPNGDYKIIEINPRPGDWPERLAQVCGANLVHVAYKETLGERVAPHRISRYGKKWANLPEDFYYCVRGYRLLGWPDAHRGFMNWWRDIRGLASDAFFDWRDPLPAWIRFKGMWREFARREREVKVTRTTR